MKLNRFRKLFLAFLFGLALPILSHAQGTRLDGTVQTRGGFPAAGATIAVCTQPAVTSTTPCSPLATLYTDSTDVTACSGTLLPPGPVGAACSNPMLSDGLGNYHFYIPSGTKVTIQFYGSGVTTSFLPDQIIGAAASLSNPFKGPNPWIDVTNSTYNAKCDGVTDDSAAYNAALAAAPASGAVIYTPPSANGCFINNEVTSSNQNITFAGSDTQPSVITCNNANGTFTDGACIFFTGGGLTVLPALNATIPAQATSMVFVSAPSTVAGDVLVIYNSANFSYSGFRAGYQAGEYVVVTSVSSNTVTFTDPIVGGPYASGGTVSVYKLTNPTSVKVRDLTIIGQGTIASNTNAGLKISFGRKISVKRVKFNNARYANLYLDRVYDFELDGNNSEKYVPDGGQGTSYAYVVGSSQEGRVTNNFGVSVRTAFALGGAVVTGNVPNRFIILENNIFRTTGTAGGGVEGADTHGNCEYITYANNILDGIDFGGNHTNGQNNIIFGNNAGTCATGTELSGFDHEFSHNKCYSFGAPVALNGWFLDVGGNNVNTLSSNTTVGGLLKIDDNTAYYGGAADDNVGAVRIINRGSTVTNLDISFTNNHFFGLRTTTGNQWALDIQKVSGNSFDNLNLKDNYAFAMGYNCNACNNVQAIGNTSIGGNSNGIALIDTDTVGAPNLYSVKGNHVRNAQHTGIYVSGNGTVKLTQASIVGNDSVENAIGSLSSDQDTGISVLNTVTADVKDNLAGGTQANAANPADFVVITTLNNFNNTYYGTGAPYAISSVTTHHTQINASGTLTFTLIAAVTCQEQSLTVTNTIAAGADATASPTTNLGNVNLSWSAWANSNNSVAVRVCNPTAAGITPNAVTWNATVIQ